MSISWSVFLGHPEAPVRSGPVRPGPRTRRDLDGSDARGSAALSRDTGRGRPALAAFPPRRSLRSLARPHRESRPVPAPAWLLIAEPSRCPKRGPAELPAGPTAGRCRSSALVGGRSATLRCAARAFRRRHAPHRATALPRRGGRRAPLSGRSVTRPTVSERASANRREPLTSRRFLLVARRRRPPNGRGGERGEGARARAPPPFAERAARRGPALLLL